MNATNHDPLDALATAIMTRAEELAREFHDKADRQRDNILRDTAQRLHLAEEREVLVAKAEAERHYRRVTQARELRLQGRLDQLRWEMVQTVLAALQAKMDALRADAPTYHAWVIDMLADAAHALPDGELVAEFDNDDFARFSEHWDAMVEAAAPGRRITLAVDDAPGGGGVRVRTTDNRAQVDNRFSGRARRLEGEIQRAILQQLFPTDQHSAARNGGLL
jgi:V/A-type H+/Na+-transporting ATPase subunit E